ncbi:MAG: PVC-type heme-binding CxxCH protein [Verrucomicrobiota bacterium]
MKIPLPQFPTITRPTLAAVTALSIALIGIPQAAEKSNAKAKKPSAERNPSEEIVPTPIEVQQKDELRPLYKQPKELAAKKTKTTSLPLSPSKGERIVFIGNSLAERMQHYGHFETLLHKAFPNSEITFRNMGFPGHTPAFRPEAGQPDPWAFPGAETFRPEINAHHGKGHYPKPDEWLTILEADTIVAFFGFNESFDGLEGVGNFETELAAFVDHTLSRSYNEKTAPNLILATPIAVEAHPDYLLPDADSRNEILAAYAKTVKQVAKQKDVGVLDLFSPTQRRFAKSAQSSPLTINGVHLGDQGYRFLAPVLLKKLFGPVSPAEQVDEQLLREAIYDKSWFFRNDYRMLNGVHAYGQRWAPYGNFNYPEEIEKIREMTALRDENIWKIAQGKSKTLDVDDAKTRPLTPVTTNYTPSEKTGTANYLLEKEALEKFTLPEGYEVSVFATEQEFPLLQNPAQMLFDNEGRLWVTVVPSYPHYKPGDELPNDKLLIYEDTDGDGRADKETVFADNLHVPIGFQFAPEGVYISEEPYLTLHKDTNGDGKSDTKEYILDGFDPHDTHHAISAFDTDYGGGIFMCEGRFLHSQVETPWGPQRMTDGGAWRFDPKSWKVDRFLQTDVSNPWGVTHDEFGQNFLNDASGGNQYWMLPLSVKVPHAHEIDKVEKFNYEHHIRPSSGSEFLHSRHFPDEVQGDYLYCNSIGFLGIKQYQTFEDGIAIKGKWRQDLIQSSDGNCRPADLELAPDGSLYFIDWHNALIGHMQHSARDPMRNNQYGRIYRITYPERPLVDPPEIAGADIETLFENFKLPELQARKRSHAELRGRDAAEVIEYAHQFAEENGDDERLVLEALWTTWGHHQPSIPLLEKCLNSSDHRIRSAAIRVVRHCNHILENPIQYYLVAAEDEHPRVRLEALAAASWLGGDEGAEVLLTVASQPTDEWIRTSLNSAILLLKPNTEQLLAEGKFDKATIADVDLLLASELPGRPKRESVLTKGLKLAGKENKEFKATYELGESLFHKDGACVTCHQANGQGVINIYPPIVDTEWVNGDKERLIKLVLHGLWGPITIKDKLYDPQKGVPPMTALGAMYSDNEVAAVLTYVRHSWGNNSGPVSAEEVKAVREATKDRATFYSPEELLKEHPLPNENTAQK